MIAELKGLFRKGIEYMNTKTISDVSSVRWISA